MFFAFFFFNFIESSYTPQDPLFSNQFGLSNNGQFNGLKREDIRVERVWNDEKFGKGIPIAVISDGCYHEHTDLAENFDLEHSWNYFSWENDPNHLDAAAAHRGTEFAGITSAAGNTVCGIGVAPKSKFSCFNIDNPNKTRENVIDSIKRDNDYFRVKLLGTLQRCDEICVHQPFDKEMHEALLNAPSTVNFVSPAGADAFRGGDTNFFPLSRNPRVIVVSDSTHRGAHSSWSNRGTSILCNAPTGGSSSFDDDFFPSMPGVGVGSPDACNDTIDPVGSGAAYVAGAIALALETNPSLTWRDIQALIIATSTVNNPSHHSWTINHANYMYSHFFGFGRVDTDLLVSAAKQWALLPEQIHNSYTIQLDDEKVPTMNNGSINISFEIDEESSKQINFIEFVQVSLNITVIDASLLRIQLTSPSGTLFNVKVTSISDDNEDDAILTYTIRGFFGETSKGGWTLHVVSDSIGDTSTLHSASLIVYGTNNMPSIPRIPRETGQNPYQALATTPSLTLHIEEPEVSCRSDFILNITTTNETKPALANMYLSTVNKHHRWPLEKKVNLTHSEESETVQTIRMNLPCYFSDNEKFNLIIEDMESGQWGDTQLSIRNTESDLVLLSPDRYQVFRCNSEDPSNVETDIEIVPAMQMKYWLDGSFGQRARVTLLNMETNEFILRKDVDMKNLITIHYNGSVCPKCLLSVVPSWHDVMHDCLTMLQPISIISYFDNPPTKWVLPLTDKCPIPPGVITPTPIPEPTSTPLPPPTTKPLPTPTFDDTNGKIQNKAAILTGSIFIGVYAVGLIIFMLFSSKRPRNTPQNVANASLLDEP